MYDEEIKHYGTSRSSDKHVIMSNYLLTFPIVSFYLKLNLKKLFIFASQTKLNMVMYLISHPTMLHDCGLILII